MFGGVLVEDSGIISEMARKLFESDRERAVELAGGGRIVEGIRRMPSHGQIAINLVAIISVNSLFEVLRHFENTFVHHDARLEAEHPLNFLEGYRVVAAIGNILTNRNLHGPV